MSKTRIRQGAIIIACCLAGPTFAQEATTEATTVDRTITTQTIATVPSSPTILRLGQVQVKDVSGVQIGTLEDIVVSPQGYIEMGVISLGGTRLVPVPWQVIRTEQSAIGAGGVASPMIATLQVDQARLTQAPSIDRAQLRTQLSQPAFSQQVNTFFGVQARANLDATTQTTATAATNLTTASTNLFGTRTNMSPTGRTNLFRPSTLPPPRTLPPTQTPGATPGRPEPGFQSPGTSPVPPGTPSTTPGVSPTPTPNTPTPRPPGSTP